MHRRFFLVFLPVLILFSGCSQSDGNRSGLQIFRYNESAGITSLDPAFARSQSNIWAVNQLYNGLLQLDDSLNIKPSLAKKYDISDDGLTYTFYLRDDVYFHKDQCFKTPDSTRKVTAGDFRYSLRRVLDDRLASPGYWVLANVAPTDDGFAIDAPSDTVLTIRLSQPFPPFAGLLCMQYCSVIPEEAVTYYDADFRANPVGTGPFRFVSWKEGVKMVMRKNQDYFEQVDGTRLPYLDGVSISFIIDKQSAFLEFVKGNLDFISGLDASYKDELLTKSGKLNRKYNDRINLETQPYLNTEYLGFIMDPENSTVKGGPLTDVRIRQAINYGFDRAKMIKYLRNNIGTPGTKGMIPAGLGGFTDDAGYGYDYRPQEARKLLREAGYPDGKGLPPVTLATNPTYLDLCQFIQSQLEQIGITIKIDVSPPATLRENMAHSRVPFFRGSWIADYPDAENYLSLFYSPNHTPQGPNYTLFKNPSFDRLYVRALRETYPERRNRLYRTMDSLAMAQAPVVVMYYDEVLRFSRKNVSGLNSNPLNLLNLKTVKKK